MATNVTSLVRTEPKRVNFWFQMCGCRFAMVAIVNLQHASTLFIKPLAISLHASLATIQVAIAVLIPTQTRLMPVECGPTLPRYEQNLHWFSKYPPAEPEALRVAGPSKGPCRDPKSKSQAPGSNADLRRSRSQKRIAGIVEL